MTPNAYLVITLLVIAAFSFGINESFAQGVRSCPPNHVIIDNECVLAIDEKKPKLSIKTTSESYADGDTITITGTTNANLYSNGTLSLAFTVKNPSGNVIHVAQLVGISPGSTFETSFKAIGSKWKATGEYSATVKAQTNTGQSDAFTTNFTFTSKDGSTVVELPDCPDGQSRDANNECPAPLVACPGDLPRSANGECPALPPCDDGQSRDANNECPAPLVACPGDLPRSANGECPALPACDDGQPRDVNDMCPAPLPPCDGGVERNAAGLCPTPPPPPPPSNPVDKTTCGPGTAIGPSGKCEIIDDPKPSNNNGCLIATAAYGSELAPQVQLLREIRDNTLYSTESGNSFMTAFNQFYYVFSPAIADLERQNPVFKEAVKTMITPMISTLSIMTLADSGSESQVLGYGISVITLNLLMYIGAPIGAIFTVKRYFKSTS